MERLPPLPRNLVLFLVPVCSFFFPPCRSNGKERFAMRWSFVEGPPTQLPLHVVCCGGPPPNRIGAKSYFFLHRAALLSRRHNLVGSVDSPHRFSFSFLLFYSFFLCCFASCPVTRSRRRFDQRLWGRLPSIFLGALRTSKFVPRSLPPKRYACSNLTFPQALNDHYPLCSIPPSPHVTRSPPHLCVNPLICIKLKRGWNTLASFSWKTELPEARASHTQDVGPKSFPVALSHLQAL